MEKGDVISRDSGSNDADKQPSKPGKEIGAKTRRLLGPAKLATWMILQRLN